MPAKKKRKTPKRYKIKPRPLDDKAKKVLGALVINPRASIRTIARQLGIPPMSVWRRLQKIRDPDRLAEITSRFDELLPLAFAVFVREIHRGNYTAARDLAFGRGILRNKQDVDHSGGIKIDGLDKIADAIDHASTAEIQARIVELEKRLSKA